MWQKKLLDGLTSRMEMTKWKVSKLNDRSAEIIQPEKQGKKGIKKWTESLPVSAPIHKGLRDHHSYSYNKKKLHQLKINAFLDSSENRGLRAKNCPGIWRDRYIQKDTAEICLTEAEATEAINWQCHLNDNFDKLLEVECDECDSKKFLGATVFHKLYL